MRRTYTKGSPSSTPVCTVLQGHGLVCAELLQLTNFTSFLLAAANILTDIAFASLPVPIIWQLQMKKRVRIYLVGILSLGYFAVLLGIVKTVCQNVFRGDPDQSFYNWIQFWGL